MPSWSITSKREARPLLQNWAWPPCRPKKRCFTKLESPGQVPADEVRARVWQKAAVRVFWNGVSNGGEDKGKPSAVGHGGRLCQERRQDTWIGRLDVKMELIGHQNYKAYRTFLKWRKQWAEMRGNGCVDAQLFGKALNLQRQLRKIDIQHKLSGDIDCTDITT
ncbi:hypothetical protein GQ600_23296 [Phytophthora cactorum]|nr:hypothetical protein GQ600_23296 [Phytophthora cactorum]